MTMLRERLLSRTSVQLQAWIFAFAITGLHPHSVLAQSPKYDDRLTQSSPVLQTPRAPLMSLVQVTGTEEFVTMGNVAMGPTLGLQGVIYREGGYRKAGNYDGHTDGYVRWHVILRRVDGQPFSRDETLKIRFLATYSGKEPEVIHMVELRQGDLESQTSFLAPSYARGNRNYYWPRTVCHVYSDGRELRGLRGMAQSNNFNQPPTNATQISVQSIALGSIDVLKKMDSVDAVRLKKLRAIEASGRWLYREANIGLVKNLPTDWRELGAISSFSIDVEDLPRLADEQSIALQQYVVAGGQLTIVNGASNAKPRDEVDRWLGEHLRAVASSPKAWETVWEKSVKRNSLMQSVGFGHLVLYDDESLDSSTIRETAILLRNNSRIDRIQNSEFMNWLIPKLGQPPVVAFCLSIGAFALTAGPLLLWWTNFKRRRPILLLLLFPFIATLITGSIFAYAILHDGFTTSGRIRSMTWVDASSGFGCAYSRQTYFSGFPDSSTIFQPTSEVWEIFSPDEDRDQYSYDPDPSNDVSLQAVDDKQVYRGLLTAREQKQWVVTTPVDALRPFQWIPASEDKGPRVRNELSEAWKLAVFVDDAKKFWVADRIDANAEVDLRSSSLEEVGILLTDALPKLTYPPGYFYNGSYSLFGWFSGNNRYYGSRISPGTSVITDMEEIVTTWQNKELAKPQHFLIQLEQAKHLDRPYATDVIETDSSHLMMGTW